ncbi:MAG TPA: thioredoxin domain-containing protein [Novosphingobium sp.]|nr:thioredoxin domain-containing protein [Novosphingobium sp.]
MTRFSLDALRLLAAPLILGLAACGGGDDKTGAPSGEPIAKVAPPAGKTWAETVVKTPDGGYRMGNPDAPIKLIEFGSMTCPHCAEFALTSHEELTATFVESGRVSFEFRNFVTNPLDLTMSMMVRCGTPESYFALVEQTYENQPAIIQKWGTASETQVSQAAALPPAQRYQALARIAGLPEFYAARGIAVDQAKTCLANGAAAEALVKAASDQGTEYDITGTPTFVLNGKKIEQNTWPEVKAELEKAGAR